MATGNRDQPAAGTNGGASSQTVQGTSPLYNFGTSPNTRAAISQKVRIFTPSAGDSSTMQQIGVLGTFNVSISRAVEAIRGIGFGDRIAELVPNVQEPITINWERALLYLSNIHQSVGYKGGVDGSVRTLAHHRWPFDIREELVFSELIDSTELTTTGATQGSTPHTHEKIGTAAVTTATSRKALITVYEACWINSVSRSIQKDQSMIMESGDFTVTDVHAGGTTYKDYHEYFDKGGSSTLSQRYK